MQGSLRFSAVRRTYGRHYGPGWHASTVTPLDQNVLLAYQMLLTDAEEPSPLLREGLTRTDLVCAATSIWFKAPLYTTRPELYEGLGKKVRTVEYGEIRNKKALPPEDEQSTQ